MARCGLGEDSEAISAPLSSPNRCGTFTGSDWCRLMPAANAASAAACAAACSPVRKFYKGTYCWFMCSFLLTHTNTV